MKKILSFLALVIILLGSFTSCSKRDQIKTFTSKNGQTLLEIYDHSGNLWKIHTVTKNNSTAYSVLNWQDSLEAICLVLSDSFGIKYAVVFTNSKSKKQTLAILDKEFLTGLNNSSDESKKWFQENAVFQYKGGEHTHTLDVDDALGAGTITVNGTIIVARYRDRFKCHCAERAGCAENPAVSGDSKCVDSWCDYLTCLIEEPGNCREESQNIDFFCVGGTKSGGSTATNPLPSYVIAMHNGIFPLAQ